MKNEKRTAEDYFRYLKKNLTCKRRTKRALIAGLKDELAERGCDAQDYDGVAAALGEPDETIAVLRDSLDAREVRRTNRCQRALPWALAGVAAAVLLLSACFFLRRRARLWIDSYETSVHVYSEGEQTSVCEEDNLTWSPPVPAGGVQTP